MQSSEKYAEHAEREMSRAADYPAHTATAMSIAAVYAQLATAAALRELLSNDPRLA